MLKNFFDMDDSTTFILVLIGIHAEMVLIPFLIRVGWHAGSM